MTNKVPDTNLMLLVFLDLSKEVGNLSLITFCRIKQLTLISNMDKFILNGQVFCVLLTKNTF